MSERPPTSHERMSGQPWDASYTGDGPAPWDTGRPQPAFERLLATGAVTGPVLDAGCGTGEHALAVAALGLAVLGVDVAETAIERAQAKARERGLEAEFAVADALHLEQLGRTFGTVLDCGLFHALDGDERARYAAGLAAVAEPGGTVHILCFSDQGPDTGPHPVSEADVRSAFGTGDWEVVTIEADRVETIFHEHGAPAWLATIRRA